MQMIEKIGYSADKFVREHEKDGLRGIVEGREIKEYVGREYVTMIRVKCTNTSPVKDIGIRDSPEGGRFFIPIHRIPDLELMIGDQLMCTGELHSKNSSTYHANLIANITTNRVYEAHRDESK